MLKRTLSISAGVLTFVLLALYLYHAQEWAQFAAIVISLLAGLEIGLAIFDIALWRHYHAKPFRPVWRFMFEKTDEGTAVGVSMVIFMVFFFAGLYCAANLSVLTMGYAIVRWGFPEDIALMTSLAVGFVATIAVLMKVGEIPDKDVSPSYMSKWGLCAFGVMMAVGFFMPVAVMALGLLLTWLVLCALFGLASMATDRRALAVTVGITVGSRQCRHRRPWQ